MFCRWLISKFSETCNENYTNFALVQDQNNCQILPDYFCPSVFVVVIVLVSIVAATGAIETSGC